MQQSLFTGFWGFGVLGHWGHHIPQGKHHCWSYKQQYRFPKRCLTDIDQAQVSSYREH